MFTQIPIRVLHTACFRVFLLVILLAGCGVSLGYGQNQPPPETAGDPRPLPPLARGTLQLVLTRQIAADLELSESQREQLRKMEQQLQSQWREFFSGFGGLSPEKRRERLGVMREKMEQQRQQVEDEVAKILLPHQQQQLNRIRLQHELRRLGGVRAFLRPPVIEALGVTPDQQQMLKRLYAEVVEELRKRIAELENQALERLLEALTPEQRDKWRRLVNPPPAERFDEPSSP